MTEVVVHGRNGRVRYVIPCHFRTGSRRVACGRKVSKTKIDSRIHDHVTCRSCKRTVAFKGL